MLAENESVLRLIIQFIFQLVSVCYLECQPWRWQQQRDPEQRKCYSSTTEPEEEESGSVQAQTNEATITHTKQEITTIYEINIYMNPGNLTVDEPLC